MAICLLALLATNGDAQDPKWEQGAVTLQDAADYWRDRAYLEGSPEVMAEVGTDVAPNQREQYLSMLQIEAVKPDDPDEIEAEQAELDALTERAGSGGGAVPAEHPYRKWGFTPSAPSLGTLFTHMFMHGGWIHLLSNMFLFFLAGPALEDKWGRPLFAAFYVLAGLASGLFFALMT